MSYSILCATGSCTTYTDVGDDKYGKIWDIIPPSVFPPYLCSISLEFQFQPDRYFASYIIDAIVPFLLCPNSTLVF